MTPKTQTIKCKNQLVGLHQMKTAQKKKKINKTKGILQHGKMFANCVLGKDVLKLIYNNSKKRQLK